MVLANPRPLPCRCRVQNSATLTNYVQTSARASPPSHSWRAYRTLNEPAASVLQSRSDQCAAVPCLDQSKIDQMSWPLTRTALTGSVHDGRSSNPALG